MITLNGKHNGTQMFEGLPQTLVHGAEEGATKVAEAVETAGTRSAHMAGQIKERVAHAGPVAHAGSLAHAGPLARRRRMLHAPRRLRRAPRLLPSTDAMLKAQLVRTSRELAHESSDLSAAVDSLNRIISTNRRAAARGRTRLLSGLAIGAALMYHLDAEHGRERRAATARMLTGMWRGQRPTPPI